MKRTFLTLLLLLTACAPFTPMPEAVKVNAQAIKSTSGPTGLGDAFYPLLGNAVYDVNHYDITLTVDPSANTIKGATTIEAVALSNLNRFNLDMSGLVVDSVSVDGDVAEFTRHQMEMTVSPRSPLAAKQAFTVAVTYHGTPAPIGDDTIHMTLGWQSMPGGTYVASEPSGAMTWFPCNNHWSDKATYTFNITVPSDYQVVANGMPLPAKENSGFSTQMWVESAPMSTYLATVVIGKYEFEKQITPKGVEILNYFPIGTSDEMKAYFAHTPQMIDFFSELIAPYPFESYGVVLTNKDLGFALETQTRSLFGNIGWGADDETVVAHELAHQWFGDSVTPATWADLWLKEGFATYLSSLWVEHSQGKAAYDANIQKMYDGAVMTEFGLAFQPIGTLRPRNANELYTAATYYRGALALHALRIEVGDDTFFTILREFYARHVGKTASTDDFVALAQEISGRDLTKFFDLWLNTYPMPPKPGLKGLRKEK
jgi:aminopeptidase N